MARHKITSVKKQNFVAEWVHKETGDVLSFDITENDYRRLAAVDKEPKKSYIKGFNPDNFVFRSAYESTDFHDDIKADGSLAIILDNGDAQIITNRKVRNIPAGQYTVVAGEVVENG